MRKLNKLAAAVTMALGVGVAGQAGATITLTPNGHGDMLLFPAFDAHVENYFTITNTSEHWVQGHIRFRGAEWSGELRDFDVVLSPRDVLVFRLADIDGDGYWEIDQSLDTSSFAWSGIVQNCSHESSGATMSNCIDQSTILIPEVGGPISQAHIEHQRLAGYVEFISEGVFLFRDPITGALTVPSHAYMSRLAADAEAGKLGRLTGATQNLGQRAVSSPAGAKGVSLWAWTDAEQALAGAANVLNSSIGYNATRVAMDVPNVLFGNAFITVPGQSQGMAYNAEAFQDFRTDVNPHRIDNYNIDVNGDLANDDGVIIHDENSVPAFVAVSPKHDYVYVYGEDGAFGGYTMESRISFNNTWGPTLADGDDHALALLPIDALTGQDAWDTRLFTGLTDTPFNSIVEVEEAIRMYGERFDAFYFDEAQRDNVGSGTAHTWYFTYYPTKFFYGERANLYSTSQLLGSNQYVDQAVRFLVTLGKQPGMAIWDTSENPGTGTTSDCPQSPCLPETVVVGVITQELALLNTDWVKQFFPNAAAFEAGWLFIADTDRPLTLAQHGAVGSSNRSFPTLGYAFEITNNGGALGVSNWRSMIRD